MNRNLGRGSASQIDWIPRSLFPPKTALCCIKAKGHFVAHAASGIPNSSLLLPLRLHTVQRAREEGSDRSAARLTGSGRFGNRGEKCKSSRTDGAGRTEPDREAIDRRGRGRVRPRAPPRGPLLIDGTGSFNQYLRHVVPTWANMYFYPRS